MRHKYHCTPDWTACWNAADLKEFLRQAREYHQAKAPLHPTRFEPENPFVWHPPWRKHPEPKPIRYSVEIIQWLYKWGRDHRVLPMDFKQFSRAITGWPGESRRQSQKRLKQQRREWARHPGRYQDPLPYRVRNHHAHVEKKEIDPVECGRRDWREHKQFNRDKSRFEGWRRGGSHRTWAKKYSNRAERRHVRECLHNEKEILPHRLFNDPWMWD